LSLPSTRVPSSFPSDLLPPSESSPSLSPSQFSHSPLPIRLWSEFFESFLSTLTPLSPFQLVYSDLSSKAYDEVPCEEWRVLLDDKIPTALITHTPFSATLFSMGIQDPDDIILESSVKCEDPEVLLNIFGDLRSLSSSPLLVSVQSHVCGGDEWSVMRCRGSTSLVLCVNCTNRTSDGNYCDSTSQQPKFPFAISCSNSLNDGLEKVSMLYLEFNDLSLPPSFSNEEATITNTSVGVRVKMSGPGYLVCGAYLNSSLSSPSSTAMLVGGVTVAGGSLSSSSPTSTSDLSFSTICDYSLIDLAPSSSYNIYCTSLSPTAVAMSTAQMLQSKLRVRTPCCRLLYVRLNQMIVDEVSVLAFALTLGLESEILGGSLEVSISGVDVNSLVNREMFAPSHVTFSSFSSLKADLVYIPVNSGSYRLNVTLSGSAEEEFRIVYPAGDVLMVKGIDVPLPAPSIQHSEFSSDGSKIKVTFTSPTNRGSVNELKCWSLFKPTGPTSYSLPSSARCVWISDSFLQISSIGSFMEPGDVLELNGGVLKARCTSKVDPFCSSWALNDPQNVTVSPPLRAKLPVVVISLASEIGPCDDLIVDLSASSGSGGRLWKSVSLVVGGSSQNMSMVQDFLSVVSSTASSANSPIVIPSGLLKSGYAYSLEVRLCNFLGACGLWVRNFVVSSSKDVPVVLLHSRDAISIFRNHSLFISGDAYTSTCGGERNRGSLLFSWSLLSEKNVILSSKEIQSVSVNMREFMLPSYRLRANSLYKLTLTAKHSISAKYSSVSLSIFVESGDLICLLVGADDLGLRVGGSLLLDLSKSYDSDVDPNSNPQPLLFELNCFQVSPSYRDSCHSLIFSSPVSTSEVFVTANSSSAMINDIFKIVLKGRSSNLVKSCEKVVQITVLPSLSPVLQLDMLSGSTMNPSSKLKVLWRVDTGSIGEVQLSVNDDSVMLPSVSLSPLFRALPNSSSSLQVSSLVIVGNSLPSQSSFLFTLSCSLVNGHSSLSSVIIRTNSPPFGGALQVNPVEGVMLETEFTLFSFNWVDEDLPLFYQFGYLSASLSPSFLSFVSSSNGMVVFRSKLQLSSASTLLPSGPPNRDPSKPPANLTCVVMVFDQMDSSSRAFFGVLVKELQKSEDDLRLFLLHGINSSRVNSDPDDLKRAISSTAAVLNRVNCSRAPHCASLNRMECWSTDGTCGECVVGYLGLPGSSNTPCVSGDIHSSPIKLIGSACQSDADCVGGLFLECNLELHICQSIQQTCPNACSGHGRCLFVSKYDLNEVVKECGLLDGSCVSHCECEDGFLGSTCTLREEEFQKRINLRHLMLENVNVLIGMENVNPSNVKAWMKTLSCVGSSDYTSLSEDSKILMSSLVIDILRASIKVGLSIEDLQESGMDGVVGMCVSGLSSSFAMLGNRSEGESGMDARRSLLMSLLKEYSDFVISDMVEEQYPMTSANPFLRSASFILSSSLSSTLSLPQSDLESLANLSQHSLALPTNFLVPLQISIAEALVQLGNFVPLESPKSSRMLSLNANETNILSLPLFVSLSPSSCSSADCVIKVVLQHKLRLAGADSLSLSSTASDSSPSFEADCVTGVKKDHKFLCPSGEELVISCNGSMSGRGHHRCPTRSLVTLCDTDVQFDSSSMISSSLSCVYSPFESNESMTTCLCNLSSLGSMSASGSVSFSLLSIEKSVVTDFVSTWETASTLSSGDVTGSWMVLVTVGGVGLSFLLMILLSIQFDNRQSKSVSSIEIETKLKHGDVPPTVKGLKLLEEALPSIFKSDPLWVKFKEEMRVYHRWLGIVFYYSPEFSRSMRVLSLFSSIMIMLFVQSVTYNIADPDDGSCEKCDDERCCLSLKSTLNSNEYRCHWESTNTSTPGLGSQASCSFREIGGDMIRMFIVAMISAIVSAPLALSVQYLIMNVLSKQCVSEVELEKERQIYEQRRAERLRSTRRLDVSPSSQELAEWSGSSLLDDLNNLLKEVSKHYMSLVGSGKHDQAREFRSESPHTFPAPQFLFSLSLFVTLLGAWGSLVEQRSSGDQSKLIEVSSGWTRFTSQLSKSSSQEEEVAADLVKELGKLRNGVLGEYRRLQGLGGEEMDRVTLEKRKRLLFLFVKDMSSEVSGEVLSVKSQRDADMSRGGSVLGKMNRVSWERKLVAGLFVTLLDGGMLFYVYLFAMNQTHSRQRAWFFSFVMWLGFEIFLSSTALVMVLHLLIPLYVWSDMSEVKKKVLKDLMKFRDKFLRENVTENDIETGIGRGTLGDLPGGFNAAKYLFLSWRVASLFPELPESYAVVQFSTPWPKKRFGKEEGNVAEEYQDNVVLTATSQILLYFLASLLHYSSLVQDIFIQTVCNCGLGYLLVLLMQLWNVSPWLAGLAVCVLLLCLYGLGKLSLRGLVKKLEEGLVESALVSDCPVLEKSVESTPTPLHGIGAEGGASEQGEASSREGEALHEEEAHPLADEIHENIDVENNDEDDEHEHEHECDDDEENEHDESGEHECECEENEHDDDDDDDDDDDELLPFSVCVWESDPEDNSSESVPSLPEFVDFFKNPDSATDSGEARDLDDSGDEEKSSNSSSSDELAMAAWLWQNLSDG
jgi:hypothetical protein